MTKLKALTTCVAVALFSVIFAPTAEALSIALSSGLDTVIFTDDQPGDFFYPAPGALAFVGTVGVFDVVFTAGFSYPLSGSTSNPNLVFNIEAYSSQAGVLTAALTDVGFGPSGQTATAGLFFPTPSVLTVPAAALSNVTYLTFFSGSNAPFGADVLLTGQVAPGAATGILPSGTGPYSLTQVLFIDNTTSGVTSVTATLSVPDGGLALSLLGFALVGVEGLRRRFTR